MLGDPLVRLAEVVDFELFRAELETALACSDRATGGRPPYDAVQMFKVLVLQRLASTPPRAKIIQTHYLAVFCI